MMWEISIKRSIDKPMNLSTIVVLFCTLVCPSFHHSAAIAVESNDSEHALAQVSESSLKTSCSTFIYLFSYKYLSFLLYRPPSLLPSTHPSHQRTPWHIHCTRLRPPRRIWSTTRRTRTFESPNRDRSSLPLPLSMPSLIDSSLANHLRLSTSPFQVISSTYLQHRSIHRHAYTFTYILMCNKKSCFPYLFICEHYSTVYTNVENKFGKHR